MKLRFKLIKGKCERRLTKEKNKLKRIGAIILSVFVLSTGFLILFKTNDKSTPEINNKPAKIVREFNRESKERNESKLFLEHVEKMKSGVYSVNTLVFGEEMMRMSETYGESSKDFVVVEGDFRIKYGIDINQIKIDYDFDKKIVILKVPKNAIKIDSVTLINDIQEVQKEESLLNKIKDIFNNDDEFIKEVAIRQLLKHSKNQKVNFNEIEDDAKKELGNLVDKFNFSDLDYKIQFIENKSIGIKK